MERKERKMLDKDVYQMVTNRNKRVVSMFFDVCGMSVDLMGDIENPFVVYKNKCLSLFVRNFDVVLLSEPRGTEVYRISLAVTLDEKQKEEIRVAVLEWLQMKHKDLYCIKLNVTGIDLYLSGYGFLNPNDKATSYPQFSSFGYKRYFTHEKATEVVQRFNLANCTEITM